MHAFFRNVFYWLVATHYITQMATGNGAFREELHRLGLVEVPQCHCSQGGPKTPGHILCECTKYNSMRDGLQERALI